MKCAQSGKEDRQERQGLLIAANWLSNSAAILHRSIFRGLDGMDGCLMYNGRRIGSPTSSNQLTYIQYMQRPCRAKVKHRRLICPLGPENEHRGSLLYLSGQALLLNKLNSVQNPKGSFDACILPFFLPPCTKVILRLVHCETGRKNLAILSLASRALLPLFLSSSASPRQPPAAHPQLLRRLSAHPNLDIFRRRLKNILQPLFFIHHSNRQHYDTHRQQYYYQSAIL